MPPTAARLSSARPGELHLLDLGPGPTPDTSPGLAVELRVGIGSTTTIVWIRGEPFRELAAAQG